MSDAGAIAEGKRARLHQRIFGHIARDILSQTIRAGEPIPLVPVLCEKFSVSRTVVREALQQLASAGLIDVRHGSGTFAAPSEKWDLLNPGVVEMLGQSGSIDFLFDDLLEIRRMFEVEAVTIAARRATAEDIEKLEALVERMHANDVTPEEDAELNLEFHAAIVLATHNRILIGLRQQLRGILSVMINTRHRRHHGEARIVSNAMHRQILDGIRERRPDRARAVMMAHIQGAERELSPTSRTSE